MCSFFLFCYQQSIGVSKMRKNSCRHTSFSSKTNVLTLAIKLNALQMLLKKVIFSAMFLRHWEKKRKILLQGEVAPSTGASAVQNCRWQIPNLETEVEIVSCCSTTTWATRLEQQNKLTLLQEYMCSYAMQVCVSRIWNMKYPSCLELTCIFRKR